MPKRLPYFDRLWNLKLKRYKREKKLGRNCIFDFIEFVGGYTFMIETARSFYTLILNDYLYVMLMFFHGIYENSPSYSLRHLSLWHV